MYTALAKVSVRAPIESRMHYDNRGNENNPNKCGSDVLESSTTWDDSGCGNVGNSIVLTVLTRAIHHYLPG